MDTFKVRLPLSQLEIAGYQSRPGARYTLLCLHGWLDNCHSFLPLAHELEDCNFVAVDLPGHGYSEHLSKGGAYEFYLYLIWLHELLDLLKLDRPILLGHSMGAAIASLYAGCYADSLRALVLIEGIGPMSGTEAEAPGAMKRYLEAWMLQKLLANTLYADWEAAVSARMKSGPLDRASAQLLAERSAELVPGGVRWRHDPRHKLPSRYAFSEAQVLAFMAKISCPSLLIEATQPALGLHPLAKARIAAIPGLRHERLEGGHHLHMEYPGAVAASMRRFLEILAS